MCSINRLSIVLVVYQKPVSPWWLNGQSTQATKHNNLSSGGSNPSVPPVQPVLPVPPVLPVQLVPSMTHCWQSVNHRDRISSVGGNLSLVQDI